MIKTIWKCDYCKKEDFAERMKVLTKNGNKICPKCWSLGKHKEV